MIGPDLALIRQDQVHESFLSGYPHEALLLDLLALHDLLGQFLLSHDLLLGILGLHILHELSWRHIDRQLLHRGFDLLSVQLKVQVVEGPLLILLVDGEVLPPQNNGVAHDLGLGGATSVVPGRVGHHLMLEINFPLIVDTH
jgi:hypothetical protein